MATQPVHIRYSMYCAAVKGRKVCTELLPAIRRGVTAGFVCSGRAVARKELSAIGGVQLNSCGLVMTCGLKYCA